MANAADRAYIPRTHQLANWFDFKNEYPKAIRYPIFELSGRAAIQPIPLVGAPAFHLCSKYELRQNAVSQNYAQEVQMRTMAASPTWVNGKNTPSSSESQSHLVWDGRTQLSWNVSSSTVCISQRTKQEKDEHSCEWKAFVNPFLLLLQMAIAMPSDGLQVVCHPGWRPAPPDKINDEFSFTQRQEHEGKWWIFWSEKLLFPCGSRRSMWHRIYTTPSPLVTSQRMTRRMPHAFRSTRYGNVDGEYAWKMHAHRHLSRWHSIHSHSHAWYASVLQVTSDAIACHTCSHARIEDTLMEMHTDGCKWGEFVCVADTSSDRHRPLDKWKYR